jgi:hypothetical protein
MRYRVKKDLGPPHPPSPQPQSQPQPKIWISQMSRRRRNHPRRKPLSILKPLRKNSTSQKLTTMTVLMMENIWLK